MVSKNDYYEPSMRLAYECYDLAIREFKSTAIMRKRDGFEKGYRAATEAIDVLLRNKGIINPVSHTQAHIKRAEAFNDWANYEPRIRGLKGQYAEFINDLQGICFYTQADPRP